MFPTANRRRAVVLCCASAHAAAVAAPAAHAQPIHQVAPGETLWQIAAVNGLSPAAIAAANGILADTAVQAGQVIRIPSGGGQTASSAVGTPGAGTTATSSGAGSSETASGSGAGSSGTGAGSSGTGASAGGIVVQPGDTLTAIAGRAGVSVTALAAHNGVAVSSMLPAGQRLSLPAAGTGSATRATPTATSTGTSASAGTGSAATTASSSTAGSTATASAPRPASGTSVDAAEIGSTAAANGVPASLARAIAWQESGFSNAAVSSVGARGVMQVMPGTWSWIDQNLSPRRLDRSSAADNVEAGTLYLQHLLRETGGDADQAAAAYYQGLSSVRQRGMYDDTKQYVRNVRALRARFGG